jgi:hypothetical protein
MLQTTSYDESTEGMPAFADSQQDANIIGFCLAFLN